MKLKSKLYISMLGAVLLMAPGCNDKLEEEPRSVLTPAYFGTAQGMEAGVTAAYSGFRYFYGTEGSMQLTVYGTDEYTAGQEGTRTYNAYDVAAVNASNAVFAGPWNRHYTYINTCNGIIELGPTVQMDETLKNRLIAEAKFLRAQYYFNLVRLYGDVPLNLTFNTTPTTEATRAPLADVYTAIIKDLTEAITALPDKQPQPGRAAKGPAMHVLAKVYLTRAGSTAKQGDDYRNAYNTAKSLIDNRATYGLNLLPDYADVHREGNEYNSEVIWTVERSNNPQFNDLGNADKENRSSFFFRMYYELLPGLSRTIQYGRPWVRYRPTEWLLGTAFGERTNDTRYNKTFQTLWLANNAATIPKWTQADVDAGNVEASKVNQPKFTVGDTAVWMPGYEIPAAVQAKTRYTILTPSEYTPAFFPTMTKYDDTRRLAVNDASIRPYIVYKLSETYLIAAEAALIDGRPGDGLPYINTIRQRAAFSANRTAEGNAAATAAMTITAADLTIDFILDERSRELTGETMRWFDLVRTGKLLERVKLYNPDARNNIQPYHVLRPVPQTQIDLTTNTFQQNTGY